MFTFKAQIRAGVQTRPADDIGNIFFYITSNEHVNGQISTHIIFLIGAEEDSGNSENFATGVERLVVEPNVELTSSMLLRRGLALAAMLALLLAGLMTNVFLHS